MTTGGPGDLSRALRQLQSLSAEAEEAEARRGDEPVESADDSGVVSVTLSGSQLRVTRVAVAADWRAKVGEGGIEAAVLDAVVRPQLEAMSKITDGWQLPEIDFDAFDPERGLPLDEEHQWQAQQAFERIQTMAESSLDQLMESTLRAVESVERALGALPVMGEPAGEAMGTEGHSVNRKVSVTLWHGQPTKIEVDGPWAETAGRQQLSDALLQAFTQAYAAEDDARSGLAGASSDGLQASVDDLRGILDQMGLASLMRPEPRRRKR